MKLNLIDRHHRGQGFVGSVTPPVKLEYAAEPLEIKLVLASHD